jgi:hypothetical protein
VFSRFFGGRLNETLKYQAVLWVILVECLCVKLPCENIMVFVILSASWLAADLFAHSIECLFVELYRHIILYYNMPELLHFPNKHT